MSASPEHGGKCRALRGDRGNRVYTDQNCFSALLTLFLFLRVCSCLFSILSFLLTLAPSDGFAATFPVFRDSLHSPFSLFLTDGDGFMACVISLFSFFPHVFSILSFLSIKKMIGIFSGHLLFLLKFIWLPVLQSFSVVRQFVLSVPSFPPFAHSFLPAYALLKHTIRIRWHCFRPCGRRLCLL